MRARPCPSIFFVALMLGCGARSEIAGVAPEASVADASTEKVDVQSCQMGLFAIAKTGLHPDTIVLDGSWVYWHDETGIYRVEKNGGPTTTIASVAPAFWPDLSAFAVGGGHVFYGDADAVHYDGSTIEKLASPGFAASASHVFAWSRDLLPTPLYRFAFDGTGGWNDEYITHKPSTMSFAPPEIVCVAEDPGVECAGQPLSGLTATDLVATANDVWFTSNDATNGARVMHVALPSLATAPIADTVGAFAITSDDAALFFTDGTNRRIRRVENKTGPVTDLSQVESGYQPVDIAVDDACVFWTNAATTQSEGRLMAAPKK